MTQRCFVSTRAKQVQHKEPDATSTKLGTQIRPEESAYSTLLLPYPIVTGATENVPDLFLIFPLPVLAVKFNPLQGALVAELQSQPPR
eukprot:IDg11557t1